MYFLGRDFSWDEMHIMCRLRCLIIYKISADPDNMLQGGCYLVKHAANQCSKQFNVDGLLNRILLLLLQRGALDLFMWGNIDGKQRKTKLKWKLFCIDTWMCIMYNNCKYNVAVKKTLLCYCWLKMFYLKINKIYLDY